MICTDCTLVHGELVYKAGGGRNLPAGRGIATAVQNVFQAQAQIENPKTFRRWDSQLASAMFFPMLRIMQREASDEIRSLKAKPDLAELVADFRAALETRTTESAASINRTSIEEFQNGSDPFTPARAASIALTEAAWASNIARGLVAQHSGLKYATWRADSKPCPRCRKLNGKRLRISSKFKSEGEDVLTPPLHPSCRCVLEYE